MGKPIKKVVDASLSPVKSILGAFEAPKPPSAPPPPVAMPMVDSEEVKRARKKSAATQKARSGRQSTILSDQSGTLGG